MNLSTNFTENESLHIKKFEAFNSNNILIEEYENFFKDNKDSSSEFTFSSEENDEYYN